MINNQNHLLRRTFKLDLESTEFNFSSRKSIYIPTEKYKNNTLRHNEAPLFGALAGQFVYLKESGEISVCSEHNQRFLGVLARDSFQYPDIAYTRESTVFIGGLINFKYYETHDHRDNSTLITYTLGDLLYISPYGFLTNIKEGSLDNEMPVGSLLARHDEGLTISLSLSSIGASLPITSDLTLNDPSIALSSAAGTTLQNAIDNIPVVDIVDDLITNDPTKALSASQGVILASEILTHTHLEADITDLDKYTKAETDGLLVTKSDVGHTHSEADITDLDKYTKAETDGLLVTKSDVGHTHLEADITDLDKYTQAETDLLLGTKANFNHIHVESDITDLDKYTQAETDGLLAAKSDVGHAHVIADVTGLQAAIDNIPVVDVVDNLITNDPTKALSASQGVILASEILTHTHLEADITDLDKYTQAETDGLLAAKSDVGHGHIIADVAGLQAALDSKLDSAHTHLEADITDLDKYTQAETDGLLATKSDVGHGHIIADVTGLQAALDSKPELAHNHVEADIADLDKYTQAETDGLLATKSDVGHGHIIADVTGLQAALDSKSSVGDIVNDLTTNDAARPLSAAQGVVLREMIEFMSPERVADLDAMVVDAASESTSLDKLYLVLVDSTSDNKSALYRCIDTVPNMETTWVGNEARFQSLSVFDFQILETELTDDYTGNSSTIGFSQDGANALHGELVPVVSPHILFVNRSSTKLIETGSFNYPFKTIQSAINAVTNQSTTIYVAPNSYTEDLIIDQSTHANPLSLLGLTFESTSLRDAHTCEIKGKVSIVGFGATKITRVRFKNIAIKPVSAGLDWIVDIDNTDGRIYFENSTISGDSPNAVRTQNSIRWIDFIDCYVSGKVLVEDSSDVKFVNNNSFDVNIETANASAKFRVVNCYRFGDINQTAGVLDIRNSNFQIESGARTYKNVTVGAGVTCHISDSNIDESNIAATIVRSGLESTLVDKYTQAEVDTLLSGKSDVGHGHVIADTTGLQIALDGKAALLHTHVEDDITGLDKYTQAETNTLLDAKSTISKQLVIVANLTARDALVAPENGQTVLVNTDSSNNNYPTLYVWSSAAVNWVDLGPVKWSVVTGVPAPIIKAPRTIFSKDAMVADAQTFNTGPTPAGSGDLIYIHPGEPDYGGALVVYRCRFNTLDAPYDWASNSTNFEIVSVSTASSGVAVRTRQQVIEVTAGMVTNGFFTLAEPAYSVESVVIDDIGGSAQVNKAILTLESGSITPTYEPDSNELDQVYIRNVAANTNGSNVEHTGLNNPGFQIEAGDFLRVTYDVEI